MCLFLGKGINCKPSSIIDKSTYKVANARRLKPLDVFLQTLPTPSGTKDTITLNGLSRLCLKDAWNIIRTVKPSTSWSSFMWKYKAPHRVKLFSWNLMHGGLLTNDILQRRGISLDSRCVLCTKDLEDISHIFFYCPYACNLWVKLGPILV